MIECSGSQMQQEVEAEIDRRAEQEAKQDEAISEIDEELKYLLENNGFSNFYFALAENQAWNNAVKAEAIDRYPNYFKE